MLFEYLDMLFGVFDILIILLILFVNWFIYKKGKISNFPWYIHVGFLICFFLILPIVSMLIEYEMYIIRHDGLNPDGHETLYIWFRIPTYWIIGLVEGVALNLILNKNGWKNLNNNKQFTTQK